MTTKTLPRLLLAALLTVTACAQPAPPPPAEAPDTRAADAAAITAASVAWLEAAKAKDAEKFLTFYGEGAVIMMEDAPDATGPAIREAITGLMADPNFSLSFTTNTVEVARSGDLAYERGDYALTMTGPDKKPATETGHDVVIWKKNAQGEWKVAVDAPISDPPPAAAAR